MNTLPFTKYLTKIGVTNDNQIKEILLTEEFILLGNRNSHNYNSFVKNGILKFNNPDMAVSYTGRKITGGCITQSGHTSNSLNMLDLAILIAIPKSKIIRKLEDTENELRNVQNYKNLLIEQLSYLVETNKEGFNKKEFEKWKKDKITESLSTSLILTS